MDTREHARRGSAAGEGVMLLDGGAQAYPRMLAAIDAAQAEIFLEVYAFTPEGVGERFLEALAAAARRGVRVSVTIDGWGSLLDGRYVAAMLGAAGCEVKIYNPLLALLVGRLRRNHRKILVVDGEVAFLGGINIGDAYGSAPAMGEVPGWADLALEVRGRAAAWLSARLSGGRPRPLTGPVRIHLSGLGGGRKLRRRYVKTMGAARARIRIAHAYFLPDQRFVRTITAAARRGVDVALLLAGRSDVPFARPAMMRLYHQLLRSGVRIFEWNRSVLHAKAAVADGTRLLAGSFNLDPLSLANLETLVEVDDAGVASVAEAWITAHMAAARRVSLAELDGRTRWQRYFWDRLGLWAARAASFVARLLGRRR